ncbi:50S ribosomal protein L21e [Candidatus Bathycorpusculum sp.]|uniref:50S ribosomal protein L21e n=1 Tax=Candidatus Bathycorpusculum sp. TaxID=2994959 RepID=UPI00281F84F3|nr:50S ribosomal protein L21e [Candidatus Termitimicrobium sp.]MCL2684803.1 50S ribosomal protein L21e [Candidatus Termitimicrobium sp.]
MMRGSKGYYSGTRSLLRKPTRARGKPQIGKLLHPYEAGNQVIIKMNSSVQKSMPHKRFHGKIGQIIEKRGRAYVISVPQGEATKTIIVRPDHLEPYTGQ